MPTLITALAARALLAPAGEPTSGGAPAAAPAAAAPAVPAPAGKPADAATIEDHRAAAAADKGKPAPAGKPGAKPAPAGKGAVAPAEAAAESKPGEDPAAKPKEGEPAKEEAKPEPKKRGEARASEALARAKALEQDLLTERAERSHERESLGKLQKDLAEAQGKLKSWADIEVLAKADPVAAADALLQRLGLDYDHLIKSKANEAPDAKAMREVKRLEQLIADEKKKSEEESKTAKAQAAEAQEVSAVARFLPTLVKDFPLAARKADPAAIRATVYEASRQGAKGTPEQLVTHAVKLFEADFRRQLKEDLEVAKGIDDFKGYFAPAAPAEPAKAEPAAAPAAEKPKEEKPALVPPRTLTNRAATTPASGEKKPPKNRNAQLKEALARHGLK